ncbi:hypothetical protein SAMN05443999_103177 [Roseovarius azorensis]|uniref:Ferrochelatase n=1 Tax=Roseovarius azorensis TaxID=1287727 RepID=A0A1H7M1I9_9RHOB|nr:hypothetical protein [Roseovarius azorensis]SEL04848.1 hypothetical protein SAMN05443999_103177 [Roseovarius azorensis]
MHKSFCTTLFLTAVFAAPALAGSLGDPVVTPEVIAAETEAASTDKLDTAIPAFFLILLVLNIAGALN